MQTSLHFPDIKFSDRWELVCYMERKKLLKKMPPFLSGGEMIESVTRESAKYAELPHKFEAGTVNAAGAIALHAAIKYAQSVGFDVMQERELAVTKRAFDGLKELPHVHVLGSDRAEEHTGILTFTIDDVHPHDVSEILIADGICVRAGHHCAQPLLNYLGISSATRASFYVLQYRRRSRQICSRHRKYKGANGIWKIEVFIMKS